MNRIAVAVTLVVAISVAATAAWFFLNQTDTLNLTSTVRITAFSVDPEGWKDPPDSWAACLFNITIENTGTEDMQGLWLKVTMFGFGENLVRQSKSGAILAVNGDLQSFTLSAGEARNFQGEMHGGTTLDSLPSPVGAAYLAQVVVGSSTVLDEAEWTAPIVTLLVVAITVTLVAGITTVIYYKKHKH
ncbi:hypothetical protein JW988_06370 [Candidatus Bathyarchaeota archaeon]|nr:hypothetical protein [Candidatus Bathyarchaeota archaeon]